MPSPDQRLAHPGPQVANGVFLAGPREHVELVVAEASLEGGGAGRADGGFGGGVLFVLLAALPLGFEFVVAAGSNELQIAPDAVEAPPDGLGPLGGGKGRPEEERRRAFLHDALSL